MLVSKNAWGEKNEINFIKNTSYDLLVTVLILVFFLLTQQVPKDIKSVFKFLGWVHLPLEHWQGLDSESEVDSVGGGVDGYVVSVEIPVVIQPEYRLVLLKGGGELNKLIQRSWNLKYRNVKLNL